MTPAVSRTDDGSRICTSTCSGDARRQAEDQRGGRARRRAAASPADGRGWVDPHSSRRTRCTWYRAKDGPGRSAPSRAGASDSLARLLHDGAGRHPRARASPTSERKNCERVSSARFAVSSRAATWDFSSLNVTVARSSAETRGRPTTISPAVPGYSPRSHASAHSSSSSSVSNVPSLCGMRYRIQHAASVYSARADAPAPFRSRYGAAPIHAVIRGCPIADHCILRNRFISAQPGGFCVTGDRHTVDARSGGARRAQAKAALSKSAAPLRTIPFEIQGTANLAR